VEQGNILESIADLSNMSLSGRHLTYIIDPNIIKNKDNEEDRGFFIKNKDNEDYEGSCWPGMSSYVDFFNPEARRYYADQ
jgi:mannosyl-oligosaccharide alpha-1,3-glucosidase